MKFVCDTCDQCQFRPDAVERTRGHRLSSGRQESKQRTNLFTCARDFMQYVWLWRKHSTGLLWQEATKTMLANKVSVTSRCALMNLLSCLLWTLLGAISTCQVVQKEFARCSFFAERVANIWNSLSNSVDFSNVARFKRTVKEVNFSKFVKYTWLILLQMFDNNCKLCVGQLLTYCVYLVALFHCLVFCRQCVCVLWTNKWWWWWRWKLTQ